MFEHLLSSLFLLFLLFVAITTVRTGQVIVVIVVVCDDVVVNHLMIQYHLARTS